MIELEKYEDMVAKKARQINKLKKQIKELSNPEQTESFYKIEYYKLLDDIEEFKQIEYEIWGNNVISESSVRTLVWRLRTKLEYKTIETIPYQGIKLRKFIEKI